MPTPDGIDLTREEDYFTPEEPQSQLVLRSKVKELNILTMN